MSAMLSLCMYMCIVAFPESACTYVRACVKGFEIGRCRRWLRQWRWRGGGAHDMWCASVNYDVSRKFYCRLCSTVSVKPNRICYWYGCYTAITITLAVSTPPTVTTVAFVVVGGGGNDGGRSEQRYDKMHNNWSIDSNSIYTIVAFNAFHN